MHLSLPLYKREESGALHRLYYTALAPHVPADAPAAGARKSGYNKISALRWMPNAYQNGSFKLAQKDALRQSDIIKTVCNTGLFTLTERSDNSGL